MYRSILTLFTRQAKNKVIGIKRKSWVSKWRLTHDGTILHESAHESENMSLQSTVLRVIDLMWLEIGKVV